MQSYFTICFRSTDMYLVSISHFTWTYLQFMHTNYNESLVNHAIITYLQHFSESFSLPPQSSLLQLTSFELQDRSSSDSYP